MTEADAYPVGQPLDAVQLRVLGSLMEKEIATPEQYPLSLNALVNACNQRSSREPVMTVTEREAEQALRALEDLDLVYPVRDMRVAKYEHRIRTVLNLRRDETAVLCLLLLRGAQTPGELRARADRLYAFDDLAAVQATLERMASRPAGESGAKGAQAMPLTVQMARQPGSREARYAHLLGEMPAPARTARAEDGAVPRAGRVEQLEAEVASLSDQIGTLAERVQRLEDAARFKVG
jgi:uncharacterized protein YceH (UPF0502 family)